MTITAKEAYIEGLKLYRDGEFRKACPFFDAAINGGIDDFDILYYRGMCHLDACDYKSALIDFEVLVRQDEKNPEWHFRRGIIYYKLGLYDESLSDLTKIPDDCNDFSLRWHYLSILYHKAGDDDSALSAIEKALIVFPTMPKIWFNAGIILISAGLETRADLAFSTAVRLDSRLNTVKREIME